MFTDPKYLPFLTVCVPEIAAIKYSFFGSKSLPFLGTLFRNLFITLRENAFILLLTFFQETKETLFPFVYSVIHSRNARFCEENTEIKAVADLKFLLYRRSINKGI